MATKKKCKFGKVKSGARKDRCRKQAPKKTKRATWHKRLWKALTKKR